MDSEEQNDIRRRIEARISQGEFLANLLFVAGRQSSQVQEDFVSNLSAIAAAVRELFENNGLIRHIPYRPNEYWPSLKGKRFAFIDGGVAQIDLPSAAPIGVRVGSYIVKPGDETDDRENFNIELALVDDLFSRSGVIYDDDFDDIAKLRDAARIAVETAAGYRLSKDQERACDAIILHGPLINPVSPYGLSDFPSFGPLACQKMLMDDDWGGDENDRQFVSLYLELLQRLKSQKTPIVGVVERSIGKEPIVLRNILYKLNERGDLPDRDVKDIYDRARAFGLNDSSLLDVVLREGEYVEPISIMRQGPDNKWPDQWKHLIRKYPEALTTYLKPSEFVTPFRIEAFDTVDGMDDVLNLVLHTSRLLPSYGFPVGLDIVDKFTKVPAWMSRSVKGQHSIVLLQKALASGDPNTLIFAKRVLAARGRDWLFRPK